MHLHAFIRPSAALAASLASLLLTMPVAASETSGLSAITPTQNGTTLLIDQSFADGMRRAGDQVTLNGVTLADGRVVALELKRFEAVSPELVVRVGATPSRSLANTMRAVRHFTGRVVGEEGSSVYVAVGASGAAATIDLGAGRERYTLRAVDSARAGLVHGEARFDRTTGISAPEVPLCGTDEHGAGGVAGIGAVPHGAHPVIEIAVDTDWEYYNIFDDLDAAAEYVASVYGAVSGVYLRDLDTRVVVSFTRFFDVPEDLYNDGDPLYQFRDDWNATMTDVHRDVAHLMTGRRNLPYGGVAWLNATCADFGYGVVGYILGSFADPVATNPGNWDINVIAHELGHNVGSQHTHSYGLDGCASGDVQRGSIMSYCHINSGASSNIDLEFHTVCVENMEAFIVTSACLESDCDGDGVMDAEEIAAGAVDADGDGIPDGCQDCDGDGVLDSVAISLGLAGDVDLDGTPDACEPDCNGNGVPDSFDIANGTSTDAYGNGVPDECEPDCNDNGISDYTEIQLDMSLDRSRDGVLDACEDCDGDGTPDLQELEGSRSIWIGASDGTVRELHPRSGVLLRSVTLDAAVSDLAIGPDGLLYASAGRKVYPIVRSTLSVLAPIVTFPVQVSATGLAFQADGTLLVGRTPNGVARYQTNGTFLGWLGGSQGAAPDTRDVFVRADGRVLVTSGDGRIRQFGADGSRMTGYDASQAQNDLYGVIESPNGADVIVASRAQQSLLRFDSASGAFLGRFDVQSSGLLSMASGLALAGDGTAYLATSANSSSTLNGYDIATGYVERTYRSYAADAGLAQAIVVAPPSPTDANGNLVPDACESTGPDFNGDGSVDAADLAVLLGAWGTAAADLNGDGTTGADDLAILLGAWSV